jgi:hypothetical protein
MEEIKTNVLKFSSPRPHGHSERQFGQHLTVLEAGILLHRHYIRIVTLSREVNVSQLRNANCFPQINCASLHFTRERQVCPKSAPWYKKVTQVKVADRGLHAAV